MFARERRPSVSIDGFWFRKRKGREARNAPGVGLYHGELSKKHYEAVHRSPLHGK